MTEKPELRQVVDIFVSGTADWAVDRPSAAQLVEIVQAFS